MRRQVGHGGRELVRLVVFHAGGEAGMRFVRCGCGVRGGARGHGRRANHAVAQSLWAFARVVCSIAAGTKDQEFVDGTDVDVAVGLRRAGGVAMVKCE